MDNIEEGEGGPQMWIKVFLLGKILLTLADVDKGGGVKHSSTKCE